MVLEHYIADLLYRYNCVVVPGFGAFLAERTSARINDTTNTFFAPSKFIAFNEQLSTNDGLLVSYIAETEKDSYENTLLKTTRGISRGYVYHSGVSIARKHPNKYPPEKTRQVVQ